MARFHQFLNFGEEFKASLPIWWAETPLMIISRPIYLGEALFWPVDPQCPMSSSLPFWNCWSLDPMGQLTPKIPKSDICWFVVSSGCSALGGIVLFLPGRGKPCCCLEQYLVINSELLWGVHLISPGLDPAKKNMALEQCQQIGEQIHDVGSWPALNPWHLRGCFPPAHLLVCWFCLPTTSFWPPWVVAQCVFRRRGSNRWNLQTLQVHANWTRLINKASLSMYCYQWEGFLIPPPMFIFPLGIWQTKEEYLTPNAMLTSLGFTHSLVPVVMWGGWHMSCTLA